MESWQEDMHAMTDSKTHRWFLQGLLCICFAGRGFFMVGFIASQIISEYFQGVTIWEYQFLSGFGYVFGIPVATVIAANGSSLRPRQLAIASASTLLLSAVLSSVGFMSTSSFWLIVLGWIASGITSAIIFVIPIIMTDTLFTFDFAVVSYAITFASMHLGSVASFVTFTKLVDVLPNEFSEGEKLPPHVITETFVRCFGVMTLILFASAILVCLCFNDVISNDEEAADDEADEVVTRSCLWSSCFSNFQLRRLLLPFGEAHSMLLMSAIFFAASAQTYSFLRMPDILWYLDPTTTTNTITIIYVCAMSGGILGCCFAAYGTLRYSKPRVLSAASSIMTLILSIGLYVSYYGRNFIGASICSVLMSLATSFLTISLLKDFLLLCEIQSHRITMVSIYFAFYNTGVMLFNWTSILFCNFDTPEAYLLLIIATQFPIPIMVISTRCSSESTVNQAIEGTTSSTDSANETTLLTSSIRE